MKKKLLIGSVAGLIGLAIGLPAYAATSSATVTVVDSSCTAFSTTVVGTNITFTCDDAPIVDPPPPPPPSAPPVCADIVTNTPNDSGVIFQGGGVILTASCPGADSNSYVWTAGGVVEPTATGSTLNVTPSDWTVYSVVASNLEGDSNEISRLVAVIAPTTAPVCTPTATPSSIDSGQSTQLDAGCDSATSYVWTSSNSEFVDDIESPIVSPSLDTTYTLTAGNANGPSISTVDVTIAAGPVVLGVFDCGVPNVTSENIQFYYDNTGNAFNRSMGNASAYTMSFITGPASSQVQELDIVEWVGAPNLKDVSISLESCNYVSPITRIVGVKPNIKFTVGVEVGFSVINPALLYPLLQPQTRYYVNLRNIHPADGSETCNGLCGMNLKFFGTVPSVP